MFITKQYLSRRTLLRGLGVSISLPFLESMVPAQTALRKTAANPKTRLTCIYVPHGAVMVDRNVGLAAAHIDEGLYTGERYFRRQHGRHVFGPARQGQRTPCRNRGRLNISAPSTAFSQYSITGASRI